jgi:hypothetical protein
VPYADFGDPQSLNLYGYVRSIPTTRTDVDGHKGEAAVWELFDNLELSAPLWTLGSVALPGLLGGGLGYYAIDTVSSNNYTRADAEMQAQVALNRIAIQINEMARAGKSTERLRKEWEKLTGKKWPKDPNTGGNQDAHHKDARADGGPDTAENIEPKPHNDHVDHHKKNGDFKRWGKRAHRSPPNPPNPEPPQPDPAKQEPSQPKGDDPK